MMKRLLKRGANAPAGEIEKPRRKRTARKKLLHDLAKAARKPPRAHCAHVISFVRTAYFQRAEPVMPLRTRDADGPGANARACSAHTHRLTSAAERRLSLCAQRSTS